jgi:uncharacterized caspase-like protein
MRSATIKILTFSIAVYLSTIGAVFATKEALLIANGDYSHFGKLPNPLPDAQALAASLRQIGFNVKLVENANREQMLDAIGAFEERLKASRGIAFFHYGGHGVQVNGRNYLIPADAEIPDEKRVATRAVELDEIMSALDASGAAANIVVLDACRDNPLPATSTRSATRGLSVVQAKPKNSIIIYAAEAGSKANDGLFTPILAKSITAPGRSITDVIMEVRRQVNQQSGGSQTPGEYNQLFDPIVLSSESLVPPPQIAATPSTAPQSLVESQPTHAGEPTSAASSSQFLQQSPQIALQLPQSTPAPAMPLTSYQPPSAPSPTIPSPWLFPDSSQRVLTAQELGVLTQDDLWRARNELFARRGYIFKTSKGKALAASLGTAYAPLSPNQDTILGQMNPVEKANVKAIQQFEKN